ncbi:hypothetical protein Y032_0092g2547 [Ancylostoma ceylanicum]|uniref:Uncharacterized protein n=1 Tax=Ancylostoma ceylanicum TaxID=53326 RepID=A0A016TMB1_9BILA|nr:hypothetical protein Y032_0092g2547 [Ancylostoma ceylanicum]
MVKCSFPSQATFPQQKLTEDRSHLPPASPKHSRLSADLKGSGNDVATMMHPRARIQYTLSTRLNTLWWICYSGFENLLSDKNTSLDMQINSFHCTLSSSGRFIHDNYP